MFGKEGKAIVTIISSPGMPYFSVVIPTYRRPGPLSHLLFSLTQMRYRPDRFEVIVVDDGGDTPLEPVLSRFQDRMAIQLLKQKNCGPAMARNLGASRAKGEYLAFVDDDCFAGPDWLQAFAQAFKESPGCLCGGKTANALANNHYASASQLLVDYLYEHYSPVDKVGAFFLANNIAVSRERFQELGGFDPTLRFGEDREICHRWRTRGYSFVFAHQAAVYHAHALTLSSFLRLHFLYGGGTVQFRRRCPPQEKKSIGISPPSWYIDLVLSGIKEKKGLKGLWITSLLMTAQGAYGAGMLWEAIKDRKRRRQSPRPIPRSMDT